MGPYLSANYVSDCPPNMAQVSVLSDNLQLHPTVEFDVLNLAYQDEKDYELMASLFRLGKKEKEVLILRYIEGYANKEIATILGVSENAVKKRLERAKKKLIQEYDK